MNTTTIRNHLPPVAVTTLGLIVAAGLATAPVLMAESDAEIQVRQNTAEIEKLITALEQSNASMEQQFADGSKTESAALSNIQNQISILNKAATRLHRKQQAVTAPSGEIFSSIQQGQNRADARMVNLEKAVTRINIRQRKIAAAQTQASTDSAPDNTDLRLTNLEKAVKNLNLKLSRESRSNSVEDSTLPLTGTARVADPVASAGNTDATTYEDRLISEPAAPAALMNTQNNSLPQPAVSDPMMQRLLALEIEIRNLHLDQQLQTQAARAFVDDRIDQRPVNRSARMETRPGFNLNSRGDIRMLRLQRTLQRLEDRLDDMESTPRHQIYVEDQLSEMRDYIDALLDELYR